MSTATITALIAGGLALATSLITLWVQHRDRRRSERRADEAAKREEQRDVTMRQLQAEIDARSRERDAQRDYEYEARKRLYSEIQPLFFQLGEASESCVSRIIHLQGFRAFRLLEDPNSSMMVNTMHRLMAPITLVHLIQRRLTAVDLRLDPALREQYRIARELQFTFGRGEEMAELDLSLQYRWGTGPADRQHLGSAETEVMVEFLTLTGHDGSARCASYPEFEARYVRDKEVRELSLPVRNWLTGANPKSKPVLWRLLIGQAFLLRLLIDMIETGTDQAGPIPPAGLQTLLTWRSKTPLPQELEPQSAQRAATAYVLARLGRGLPDVSG